MVSDKDKILVDRYLRNELSQDELAMLEQRLIAEEQLRLYVSDMKALQSAMRSTALEGKLAMLKEIPLQPTPHKLPKSNKWLLWALLMAVLAIASYYGHQQQVIVIRIGIAF